MTNRITLNELAIEFTFKQIDEFTENILARIEQQIISAATSRETSIDIDISNHILENIDVWLNTSIQKQIELETANLNLLLPDTLDENKQSVKNKWNPRIMKNYYEILKDCIVKKYANHTNPEINIQILFYRGTKSGQRLYMNWK